MTTSLGNIRFTCKNSLQFAHKKFNSIFKNVKKNSRIEWEVHKIVAVVHNGQ